VGKSEADKQAAVELGKILLRFIGSALVVRPDTDSPEDIVASGTFSYIDTGLHKFIVTCDHVFAEFERLRAQDNRFEFCWGVGPGIRPLCLSMVKPRDRHKGVDLCTFQVVPPDALQASGKCFMKPIVWPPARVAEGDLAIGIGFPGAYRHSRTSGAKPELGLVASLVSGTVHSVTDRHFTIADEGSDRLCLQLTNMQYEASWGGMSGGMFFRVEAENEYHLAGFLRAGGSMSVNGTDGSPCCRADQPDELHSPLFVAHADLVLEDGELDHLRIPEH
jgi:hypothetical protein